MWYIRVGSSVRGPFSDEQLHSLRLSGRFTATDQISNDRMRWTSAAQVIELLNAKATNKNGPLRVEHEKPIVLVSQDTTDDAPAESSWYYIDSQRQRCGPITLKELRRRIEVKQILPITRVCRDGDAHWIAVLEHPLLKSSFPSSPRLAILTVAVSFVVVGLLLTFHMLSTRTGATSSDTLATSDESSPEPSGKSGTEELSSVNRNGVSDRTRPGSSKSGGTSQSENRWLITSLSDEAMIQQAVGLVVSGERIRFPDGTIQETPESTGSCFAITPNGHLLTNRHVVTRSSKSKDVIKSIDGRNVTVAEDSPIVVYFNRVRFEAEILFVSDIYDMAILQVVRHRGQPFFALSRRNQFPRATKCFALGFPGVANRPRSDEEALLLAVRQHVNKTFETKLLDQHFEYSYQPGEISRVIQDVKKQFSIEHSAKIFPGNSGGPLSDSTCTVIGVNTLISSDKADTLYIAFSTGQFSDIINEIVGAGVVWND